MRGVLLALALAGSGVGLAAEGTEEAVDLDALDEPGDPPPKKTVTRVPEHDYDRRLLVFPLLLVALLAWNVKWKPDPVASKKPAPGPAPKEGSS